MGTIGKAFAFFLMLIIVMSCLTLLLVKPASAQTIPKPSVPEFTAKLVDRSYNVPATTAIDPYTGQTINNPAHRVENYTIDLTIKNQPYTPVVAENGVNTDFVYQVQVKGHFATDWIPMYPFGEGPKMSNTDYTVITYLLLLSGDSYYLTSHDSTMPSTNTITGLPPNASIDFQIEALSGYWTRTIQFASQHFEAQESGWSPTQTVSLPASSVSPTQTSPTSSTPTTTSTPTSTPTTPDTSGNPTNLITLPLEGFVIIVVVVVSLAVALSVLLYTRHRKAPLPV
jgi:hypothetical protein